MSNRIGQPFDLDVYPEKYVFAITIDENGGTSPYDVRLDSWKWKPLPHIGGTMDVYWVMSSASFYLIDNFWKRAMTVMCETVGQKAILVAIRAYDQGKSEVIFEYPIASEDDILQSIIALRLTTS